MTSKRGEIATVIALGTLLIIGISSLISSTLLNTNKKQTTQTKASELTGSCDEEGQVQIRCTGQQAQCLGDAGEAQVFKCEEGQWAEQQSECHFQCSKNTQTQPPANDTRCEDISAGTVIEYCSREVCDATIDKRVCIEEYCDAEGRVQEKVGRISANSCSAPTTVPNSGSATVAPSTATPAPQVGQTRTDPTTPPTQNSRSNPTATPRLASTPTPAHRTTTTPTPTIDTICRDKSIVCDALVSGYYSCQNGSKRYTPCGSKACVQGVGCVDATATPGQAATPTPQIEQPTATPTLIPSQQNTCTDYTSAFPQRGLKCPETYSQGCGLPWARGTRYVNRGCATNTNTFACIFSCQTIDDIRNGRITFSGNCNDDVTCIQAIKTTYNVRFLVNSTCSGKIATETGLLYFENGSKKDGEKKELSRFNNEANLTLSLDSQPQRDIQVQGWVLYREVSNPSVFTFFHTNLLSLNTSKSENISLQIDYNCQ